MKNIMYTICLTMGLLALAGGVANADIIYQYELDASIAGYQDTSGDIGFDSSTAPWYGKDLAVGIGIYDKQSWAKYDIPAFPGERIVEVRLHVDDIVQHTSGNSSGWRAYFSPDNVWTAADIASEHTVDGSTATTLIGWSNSQSYPYNARAAITHWFSNPNALQGQQLTVRYNGIGGGGNRADSAWADGTLIIRTVPEPGALALLAAGSGLILVCRRVRFSARAKK
ncbi:MAG: PEP-CTERM sorting domain-containing protein [Candidatus Pacebacteria bacterium]|nr:PEP-CTERM sorting domain-containing protein [Candidatus Paceibacterota bacterium]